MNYADMKDEISEIENTLRLLQRELDKKNNESIADDIDELFRPLRKIRGLIVEAKLTQEQNR